LQVEIWSDIACPWCYVGKRRFEAALAAFEHRDEVQVIWRAFELDPDAPAEREGERAARLAEKYNTTVERAREMERNMTDTAAGEGLAFRFDIARSGATFDAHRVVHLAALHGLQDEMKERLLKAHLGEGELMSDHDTLVRLGEEIGLPKEELIDTLASDRFAAEVREEERTAFGFGISAVPTFVIDRQFGVSGAQPPELLLEMLRRGWEARTPVEIVSGGEVCGPDGC
jgi:predicted DsbA family dithiol-disulfide isomerase